MWKDTKATKKNKFTGDFSEKNTNGRQILMTSPPVPQKDWFWIKYNSEGKGTGNKKEVKHKECREYFTWFVITQSLVPLKCAMEKKTMLVEHNIAFTIPEKMILTS